MPLFHWKGPGKMVEMDLTRSEAPELTMPAGVEVNGAPREPEQRYICVVEGCKKEFKKPMIAARHFNSNHADLRESSDSWREYIEEYWK